MQTAEYAAVGIDDPGWMFTRPDGRPVHPHTISQTFERIARRAAVPVIRLHDLRHTAATLLIAAGIPVKVVSERLGHANQTFTIETSVWSAEKRVRMDGADVLFTALDGRCSVSAAAASTVRAWDY